MNTQPNNPTSLAASQEMLRTKMQLITKIESANLDPVDAETILWILNQNQPKTPNTTKQKP
jgi:hypothetical protein